MKIKKIDPKLILIISCIALISMSCSHNSIPINGFWIGSMEMNGKTVDISIDLNGDSGTFSSNDLMLFEHPISNIKNLSNHITFSINLDVQMIFKGKIEKDHIHGTVNIDAVPPSIKINFELKNSPDPKSIKEYAIEKLSVQGKGVTLSAEIYKPNTNTLHPGIVLLHGSTTNLKTQYTAEADIFARLGFEVLIFDKRGNGNSTGNYATSNYSDLAQDALNCVEVLRQRESVDKQKIGLWGFSQGAMLLPMIAAKSDHLSFLIAKSPEVISVTEAAAFSDRLRVIQSGNSTEDGKIVLESHQKVGKLIAEGRNYQEIEQFIRQNASKYPFMNQTGLYGNIHISKGEFDGYYWRDRIINFLPYWKDLKIPTLALFGEDDAFLNAIKNEEIIRNLNKDNIVTKLLPRCTHNMKKAINPAKYHDFDWPRRVNEYDESIQIWIKERIKN